MIGRACGYGLFDRVLKMAFSSNDKSEVSVVLWL